MKKIIIIAVAVVLLIVVGVGAFFMLNKDKGDKEKEIIYFEYEFPEDYANIGNDKKILKYVAVIQYTDEDILAKIKKNESAIKAKLNVIFKKIQTEDIPKVTLQDRVAGQIRQMIIEVLESDEETISDVFLTTFIIQG